MSEEDIVGRVLDKLREHRIIVARSAVEVVRKTKSGYNVYTSNYIIFLNTEKGSAIIRSNHYLEDRVRGRAGRREHAEAVGEDGW